jgi:capsular exopolysaccharide synthesis family protein
MSTSPETRTLRDYLRVLRERRLIIAFCVVAAVGAALAYSLVRTPQYSATATVGFRDISDDLQAVGGAAAPNFQPDKLAAAGARTVTRPDVVANVKEALGTDLSTDDLESRISTEVETDSNLVRITATAGHGEEAAALANEFAKQTQVVLREEDRARVRSAAKRLQAQLDRLGPSALATSTGQAYQDGISRLLTLSSFSEPVEVVRPAEVPSSPSSPKPIRDTLIAAALGLLIGIAAALLRHSLDRRLREPHEVQKLLGLPLVGSVGEETLGPAVPSSNGDGLFSEDDLEAFRILRTNFEFLAKDRELRSVVVTSPLPEEGKSTVAAYLAYASAVAGRRTLLVECDFRRPVLAERFGLDPSPGLSEFLGGGAEPSQILRSVAVQGGSEVEVLPVIPAGHNVFHSAEMLGSKLFGEFLDQVTDAYELVVLDGAPLLPVGDTLELLPQVDSGLFCVRLGQTTRDQVVRAKAVLEHLPELPIGLVVTGVKRGSEDNYYGYYSHQRSTVDAGAEG